MKTNILNLIIICFLICGLSPLQAEPFEDIKKDLAGAEGLKISFLSLIESSVFETVDSLSGMAHICSDGRYFMKFGDDQYLFEGSYLYSYSLSNNQVTVESMSAADQTGDQVTFISRLDDYFITTIITQNEKYELIRKDNVSESLPEKMLVRLNSDKTELSKISYSDINEDLNHILIDSIIYLNRCDSIRLIPAFPDSVEVVKLY